MIPYHYECKFTKLLVIEVEIGNMRPDRAQEHIEKVKKQFNETFPEISVTKIFVPMKDGNPTIRIREIDLGPTGITPATPSKNA